MRSAFVAASAAFAATVSAQYKGFNYGSTNAAGTAYALQDFTNLFNTAAGLSGASGFTSARLYTMIQGGTTDVVTSAIPAAINTNTKLLLGLWASGGDAGFQNEMTALKNAIQQFPQLSSNLAGISVGSEDLYRISPSAAQAGSTNPGAEPATVTGYIQQVRNAIAGTAWSAAPVGHVDTWTAFANTSNDAVAAACDFVGVDAYPYFQTTDANAIANGASLFQTALDQLTPTAKSKSVWITETGWPVSGSTDNQAVPSIANAEQYWNDVGCDLLFGKYNTFWYTLSDAPSSPSFGVVGQNLGTTPLYNLTCANGASSSSSKAVSSSTPVSSAAAPTVPVTGAASVSSAIPTPTPGSSLGTQSSAAASNGGSVTGSGNGAPQTAYTTTFVTVTTCPEGLTTVTGTSVVTPPAASTAPAQQSSAPAPSASGCAADLNGDYQYPHLIVPVSSTSPNTALGTQYNGTISSTVSTIFNFDIPASYQGKTCSLVFLLPQHSQLQTSAYTFNGKGGISSALLNGVADQSTTYANAPAPKTQNGAIAALVEGSSTVISSEACPAGAKVSFELSSTGGLDLEYFQDYNPSPIGLYVRAC